MKNGEGKVNGANEPLRETFSLNASTADKLGGIYYLYSRHILKFFL